MHPEDDSYAEAYDNIIDAFPQLKNLPWELKSPPDKTYKCIAWAACKTDNIWWPHGWDPNPPGLYWPPGVPHDEKVSTFILAFERQGYRECKNKNAAFEFGYQKVAIYAWHKDKVTHMARQRFFGNGWLSKPGTLADIVHPTLESIATDPPHKGDDYGVVFAILKRGWWRALIDGSLFRCAWYALWFWWYRWTHYEI